MSRWASDSVRKQREEMIIKKYLCGWRVTVIAGYIGIAPGSVSHIIAAYAKRIKDGTPVAQE